MNLRRFSIIRKIFRRSRTPVDIPRNYGFILPYVLIFSERLLYCFSFWMPDPNSDSEEEKNKNILYWDRVSALFFVLSITSFLLFFQVFNSHWLARTTLGIIASLRIVWFLLLAVEWGILNPIIRPINEGRMYRAARAFFLAIFGYIESIFWYASLYLTIPSCLEPSVASNLNAVHLSWTTQLSVGYGNLVPNCLCSLVAATQAIVGLVLLVVVLSTAMGNLSGRSAQTPNRDEAQRSKVDDSG